MVKPRRIMGDILIALTVVFTVYICVIMTHRINTVVLKGACTEPETVKKKME